MNIAPVTLKGRHIRLEPLSLIHLEPLCEIGLDDSLWRWVPTQVRTRADLCSYIEEALRDQDRGAAQPFATVLAQTGRVVGSTRYANIEPRHRRVEIGWTWIGRPWQRTVVNTEAKYLLLRHAFETLGCLRVELKTDALNEQSRRAILRIGAQEEGVLRQHMVTESGRVRETVYFSIVATEWPRVKSALETRLAH
jgi:RimJ/RimL family protein N-acetyltransferase